MRKRPIVAAVAGAALVTLLGTLPVQAKSSAQQGAARDYVVVYNSGVTPEQGAAAVRAAGGVVVSVNKDVGVAEVRSTNPYFADAAAAQPALFGAAADRPIGFAPRMTPKDGIERDFSLRRPSNPQSSSGASRAAGIEPLFGLQWGNQMIHATYGGSYKVQKGDPRVLVASIDTGVDATHPDIAPVFNRALSRNFTWDIPLVDGPCEYPNCHDPNWVDDNGHGTHTSGTMAAAMNGLGTVGIAPKVTLVNLRAGHDSGYFFTKSVVDALTYAGNIGVDVANMSFFTDPWLYNCNQNPADNEREQRAQRAIREAHFRAMNYAHDHGVTMVVAEGNEGEDLGHPTTDETSPDFPPGTEKLRHVSNNCLVLPQEGPHAIDVSALGVKKELSYFSNYGVEQSTVSAPGGDRRWFYGTPEYDAPELRTLSTFPKHVLQEEGLIDENGVPLTPLVIRNCHNGVCGYYIYFQGTSMAAPHAAGVAALIVSQFGHRDAARGGLTLAPDTVRSILVRSATDHACPDPRRSHYPDPTLPSDYKGTVKFCEGTPEFNGFYGNGIVDALRAVS